MNYAAVATISLAVACAALSIPVVVRRWAFIGEGIGHSGFGGAGTAWVLSLFFPALDTPAATSIFVVLFCLATAGLVGALSLTQRVRADAAIGIFLVATLAWGFIGQQIYFHNTHRSPAGFDALLFGQIKAVSPQFALAALAACSAVVVAVVALRKEIVGYCFDPLTARTGGIPTTLVHFLLMFLVAVVIIVGVGIAGSVLVTALLVLPGATAMLLFQRLGGVTAACFAVSLIGAMIGLTLSAQWAFIPLGPAIVLAMFVEFLVAYGLSVIRR